MLKMLKRSVVVLSAAAVIFGIPVMGSAEIADWQGAGFYLEGNGSNVHYYSTNPNGHTNDTYIGNFNGEGSGGEGGSATAEANQKQKQSQSQSSYNKNTNTNNNMNYNSNKNTNTNTNANLNYNNNTNTNSSTQANSQTTTVGAQTNSQNTSVGGQSVTINEAKNLTASPEINPYYLAPLQGGKVGDCTKSMPRFANPALVKLNPETDIIVKVLDVYFGSVFSRITYEEVEQYLLEKASKYDGTNGTIRYSVKWQDSVITAGMGGGGAVAHTSDTGLTGNSAAILPGATKSTANPIFIITFYEIQAPVVAKVVVPTPVKAVEKKAVVITFGDTHFAHDSASLTPVAKGILDKNIKTMKDNPNSPIRVEGYTSQSGSVAYNQKLSVKRASTVKSYLVKEGNISSDRITAVGYGKSKSAYEKNPKDKESDVAKANRKVVILFSVDAK